MAVSLGISSGCFFPCPRRVETAFMYAAELGLDGVEIICDRSLATHDPVRLSALSVRYGVPVLSLHSPFPGQIPDGWRPTPRGTIGRTIGLARRLGARHVVVHVPARFGLKRLAKGRIPVPHPSAFGFAQHRWMNAGGLRALQRTTDVLICVENLPRIFRRLPDSTLFWWNDLCGWSGCHDYLTLDTTHWATKGSSPMRALAFGGKAVRHIHLSNYSRGSEHRLPDDGELDLAPFLEVIAADPVPKIAVIELAAKNLPSSGGRDVAEALGRAVRFCRDHLTAGITTEITNGARHRVPGGL